MFLCDRGEVVKIASLQVALSYLSKKKPHVLFKDVLRGLCLDLGFDYDDPVVTASLTLLYEGTTTSKIDWERFLASELRNLPGLTLLTRRYVNAFVNRITIEVASCLLFDCWRNVDDSRLLRGP